ncbi:MAG: bifunctional heptose 7-phosphate kinase/heptose 1-phosphate adenyltransferase [Planctomycetota bacterium]|jgi:rfaE bifunctional protein kinase chain/domain
MGLAKIVARFKGKRIVVLGDLAVDCYVETRPARLSREAPVVVLKYERRRYLPGCAASTVMNLLALGAEVVPIGIVGDDEPGTCLCETLRAHGVPDAGLVVTGTSVLKVRLMSGDFSRPKQQVARIDVEPEGPYAKDALLELIARAGASDGADGIVVSDYGYGSASPGLLRAVRQAAPEAVVSVDSRLHVGDYGHADVLTPNEWEASEYLGTSVRTDEEAKAAAAALRERAGAGAVLLTRGNRGMVLADTDLHLLPIVGSKEIVDPSGAGDTVVAAVTMARAAGAGYLDAARIANHAAGVSVMKAGAAGVTAGELEEAIGDG